MKKSIPLWKVVILIVLAIVITAFSLIHLLGINKTVLKIAQIDKLVGSEYLFELNNSEKEDALALSYVQFLEDEYADYYNPEAYSDVESNWQGEEAGLGISIAKNPETDEIIIVYVGRSSPAKQAGIKAGDQILKVGKTSVEGLTPSDVAGLVKGPDGKKVKLLLKRGNKQITVSPTRAVYEADAVSWEMVDKIGYIKISDFNELTLPQFETAIKELTEKNAKGLIFDLRNNGGGRVDACTDILDILLPKGDIMKSMDKKGNVTVEAKSDKKEIDLPMAVLINENTASSAEMFAFAIRNFNKGSLIGVKSYGKGIVQTTYELYDGTAVKFTTAKVVDDKGNSYHGKGINPDIKVELSDYEKQMFLFLSFEQDSQFQTAKDYILGK